jgi:hypothetical protein
MSIPYKRALAIFKQLRAKNPTYWAGKESKDGKPFLARFLFLKAMWGCVIGDDKSWMQDWADSKHPTPSAIQRMLVKGIDPDDLTDVVRDMQITTLFNVCCALDNSAHGIEDLQEKITENVEWRLAEYDGENEELGRPMLAIHDDLYEFDPTGRAGNPRKPGRRSKKADSTTKPIADVSRQAQRALNTAIKRRPST